MIRVGVLRGGVSPEYHISLKSGEHILSCLRNDFSNTHTAIDLLLDTHGVLHMQGLPIDMEKLSHSVDVLVNALHGDFGEDGKMAQLCRQWGISHTGSDSFPSAQAYNKVLAKDHFARLGIQTPKHMLFPVYQEDIDGPQSIYAQQKAHEVLQAMPGPWIIKPFSGGSSMGIRVCKTYPDLIRAFTDGINQHVSVLVEEFIEGREASVGIIKGFRGQDLYSLPPVEIRLPKLCTHFDILNDHTLVCPGGFSKEEKKELERLAKEIHSGFGLNHYSRSDFIIHPRKGIFVLEVNSLPGLSERSLFPKGLEAVGSSMKEFLKHLLDTN